MEAPVVENDDAVSDAAVAVQRQNQGGARCACVVAGCEETPSSETTDADEMASVINRTDDTLSNPDAADVASQPSGGYE